MRIDDDGPARAQRQAGLRRQRAFGRDADGEHDHIRRRQHAAVRMDDDAAVCLRKARNRAPQQQFHALLPHMRVEEADHIRVKLSQKLRLLFDNRHAQPPAGADFPPARRR